MTPGALLLLGTCGSGKSTVAGLLAELHGRARFSEHDVWRERYHLAVGRDFVVDATVLSQITDDPDMTSDPRHCPASLDHLLDNNRDWAEAITADDATFFERLAAQQTPDYLWIGCSDSRVPANQIVGLLPGEMFVHRNIANVVVHADLNCLSAIQFAVDVLKVGHIIVCGHYGCGGVLAALRDDRLGLVDNWLRHVQDVRWKHLEQIEALDSEAGRHARLCELNVIEQVVNVSQTTVVRDAWSRGQPLAVHGWIYDIGDGRLRDLGLCTTEESSVAAQAESARSTLVVQQARSSLTSDEVLCSIKERRRHGSDLVQAMGVGLSSRLLAGCRAGAAGNGVLRERVPGGGPALAFGE